MKIVKYDNHANPLDCALQFFDGDFLVSELLTSQPEAHPKVQEDWCNGNLSYNQLCNVMVDSDAYEGRIHE